LEKVIKNLFFLLLALVPLATQAQTARKMPKVAKIGYIFESYSGATNKSLSEGQPGQGLEISIDDGGENFRYFATARLVYSSGTQNFLDGSTAVRSNYELFEMSPEIGFNIYPVARKMSGLNIFLWGVGIVSYSQLQLSPLSTTAANGTTTAVNSYSVLRRKDQGYAYGFGAGVGVEVFFGNKNKSGKRMLYANVGFREQTANLAQVSDFQLNSLAFSMGIGF